MRISVFTPAIASPFLDSTAASSEVYQTESAYAADVRGAFYSAYFPDWAADSGVVSVQSPVQYRVTLSLSVGFPDGQSAAAFAANASAASAAAMQLCPAYPLLPTAAPSASAAAVLLSLSTGPLTPSAQAQAALSCLQALTLPSDNPPPAAPRLLASAPPSSPLSPASSAAFATSPQAEAVYTAVIDADTLGLAAADVAPLFNQQSVAAQLQPALAANYLPGATATLLVQLLMAPACCILCLLLSCSFSPEVFAMRCGVEANS